MSAFVGNSAFYIKHDKAARAVLFENAFDFHDLLSLGNYARGQRAWQRVGNFSGGAGAN